MKNSESNAFPLTDENVCFLGLTKREYFAGLAMQGLLAAHGNSGAHRPRLAKDCIEIADELLKQLEK